MNKPSKHVNVIFPVIESAGPRDWGQESILCVIPNLLSLKELRMKKGASGGLQYHRLKNECGILIEGKMLVRYDDGEGNLCEKIIEKGQPFHFPPGSVHQEEALEDCIIIEASSPHFNDRVRIEDEYGIKKEEGLPTTTLNEIIHR